MPIIALKDIGKIYVSEGNVAVGIRNVNLSFELGEFVAVTGESGSGKSTLLNVISGMDSYEEGEMLVDGEPTSHFIQQDWEEYRRQYISFIFQDYNIIESFTVLQNVELALMHIEDVKERRERALELLHRVGLDDHINHKSSKLSGGQKQRTVIARALAKDSPIILADEPTGNLDSKTSAEIIELLREVSADKLVIVVTHSFEQVENCATRHIRVFDGAIESDHTLRPPEKAAQERKPKTEKKKNRIVNLRNGMTLGRVRFAAMPKMSVFLCILMIISAVSMTLVTSLSKDALGLFEKDYVFTHIDGRAVVVRQDGGVITDAELAGLAEKTSAKTYMHYDYLLDKPASVNIGVTNYNFSFSFGKITPDIGRAPEKENEIALRVPVSLMPLFGETNINMTSLPGAYGLTEYEIVGIDYIYDNTKPYEIIMTPEGYSAATALYYFASYLGNYSLVSEFKDSSLPANTVKVSSSGQTIYADFGLEEKSFFVNAPDYLQAKKDFDAMASSGDYSYTISQTLRGSFSSSGIGALEGTASMDMDGYTRLSSVSEQLLEQMNKKSAQVVVSPDIIVDFMTQNYYSKAYTQASLFYGNDAEANRKVSQLQELGYTAVPSDALDAVDGTEKLLETLLLLWTAAKWAVAVVFIALFISLCSSRAMLATKGDIAILRSMGVSTPVIKISIYAQTLISLIPAFISTAVLCAVIFMLPATNIRFAFLQPWQYAAIVIALFAIAMLLSKGYVKKMFGSSVKKTLKGDISE